MDKAIIPLLSDGSVQDLHNAVKKAIKADNDTPEGVSKPYCVHETKDWEMWSAALESELESRDIKFDKIIW